MTLLFSHEIEYMKRNRTEKFISDGVYYPIEIGVDTNQDSSFHALTSIAVGLGKMEVKEYLIPPELKELKNNVYFVYWPKPNNDD